MDNFESITISLRRLVGSKAADLDQISPTKSRPVGCVALLTLISSRNLNNIHKHSSKPLANVNKVNWTNFNTNKPSKVSCDLLSRAGDLHQFERLLCLEFTQFRKSNGISAFKWPGHLIQAQFNSRVHFATTLTSARHKRLDYCDKSEPTRCFVH